jgi:UDP-glucose 4-epimerase
LKQIFEEWKPGLIINAAGKASVAASFISPEEDYLAGPFLCFQILEAMRKYSPGSRMLFISSAAVYGQPAKLPIDESMPVSPLSPYGYHKKICEVLIEEYVHLYKLNAAIVRIFSAYGNGLRKQIIWDTCKKCRDGGAIILGGTGNESRDFIHMIDISRALMRIREKGCFTGTVYNLASGIETSIRTLTTLIMEKYGVDLNKLHFTGESRIGDPQNWWGDITRLKELKFELTVSLDKGIGEYVQWFKKDQKQ